MSENNTTMIPLDPSTPQGGYAEAGPSTPQGGAGPAMPQADGDKTIANAQSSTTAPAKDVREGRPSASGLSRLVGCPASWVAEQLAGEDEETEAARHGTELHAHMEHVTTPEDAEDADAVEWCRRTERELAERYLQVPAHMTYVEREQRLWDSQRKFSGQADAVFMDCPMAHEDDRLESSVALVVDYKFGRGEVDGAERNYQLAALAHLVSEKYPSLQTIYAAILQPFVSQDTPRVVKYTRASLPAARDAIYAAIEAAERPGAEFRPSMHACKYCKAAKTCPACSGHTASLTVVKRWDELSLPARAELYRRAKLAEKLAEKIQEAVRRDLASGVKIPGLKLAAGSKKFTVTDAGKAFGLLSSELGVTPDEFTKCCQVGITKLDKVVHEKYQALNPKQTQDASRTSLRKLLEGCAEMKQSAGSIKECS